MGSIWRSLRIGTAFARRCDVIGIQMRPPKDAAPELGYSHWHTGALVLISEFVWYGMCSFYA